jgi:hypothetical protein
MTEDQSPQGGSQKASPTAVTASVAVRGELPPAPVATRSQTSGDGLLNLVMQCAGIIDNGLAPLVAAGLVKPGLAAVLSASLRVGIGETCGDPIGNKVLMPRTLKAVEMLGKSVELNDQIGGA